MFKNGNAKMALIVPILILALVSQSTSAYAWGRRGYYGGRGYGRGYGWGYGRAWGWGLGGLATGLFIGSAIASRPAVCETVVVGNVPYYYSNGYYYQQDCYGRYVIVNPPVVVAQPQVIVQQAPQVIQQAPQVIQQAPAAEQTINIPNTNGSYTAVKLVRKDNGYVGPQGEYYPEFPSVEQLKTLYGK